MAFFRTFLSENSQEPDTTFTEKDEAALVLFLLMARLQGSAADLEITPDFEAPDELPPAFRSLESRKQLQFVSGFLCFFGAKPMQYMRDIRAFREYFIPLFASDRPKQIQLAEALRGTFFSASLEDVMKARSLDLFFDVRAMSTVTA